MPPIKRKIATTVSFSKKNKTMKTQAMQQFSEVLEFHKTDAFLSILEKRRFENFRLTPYLELPSRCFFILKKEAEFEKNPKLQEFPKIGPSKKRKNIIGNSNTFQQCQIGQFSSAMSTESRTWCKYGQG
jgi:hypothetical protein